MPLDIHPIAESTWGAEEVDAATAAIRSGHTTMGEQVRAFEREFAAFLGCRHAVMVNSGSSANLLMIAALHYTQQLPRGTRVAVPAVGWATTYAPLHQFGMKIVPVDVDDSFCIDPDQIPRDVDCVLAVNLLGNPCDFDRIADGPVLLEDNCEALGARYGDRYTGTIGKMGSHSLFFAHHIHTMEGGVITTDDAELDEALRMLRAHGWRRDLDDYRGDFSDRYEFHLPGFNVRPTELQGAIGREQLKKLPEVLRWRRKNGMVYSCMVGHQRENGASSWFGLPFIADDRPAALERLSWCESRPIASGNITRHPVWRFYGQGPVAMPMADRLHDCGFYIGCPSYPAREEIRRVSIALHAEAA
jgi:CDP-6-deoxy-D-xylo-4-hexulose-3-dehydrase